MLTPALAMVAAASAHRAPLGGHLWHTLEALGFLITSLGGIAAAEYVQARKRRHATSAVAERPMIRIPVGVGAGPSVGLPHDPDTEPAAVERQHVAPTERAALLPLVALAGAAAAAVHFVVMPEHFEEATLYGVFFAAAATSQLLYSIMLLARPSRTLLAAGALGNAAIVVLWLVTRTIGIPLGPASGSVESFGILDVLASGFELVAAVGAIALICRTQPLARALRPSTWSRVIWLVGPAAAIAISIAAYSAPPS
jgi:hypothetical protein